MNDGIPTIRVKDFAKVEFSQFKHEKNEADENKCSNDQHPIDIETISLSSNEDFESAPTKIPKRTPKQKLKRSVRGTPSGNQSRTPKPPQTYKYHKISEYFSATKKKDSKIGSRSTSPDAKQPYSGSNDTKNAENEMREDLTDAQRYKSSLRQVKNVLRRLSIEKTVETARKRKVREDQSKLPEFIEYEPSGDQYFATYDQSTYNAPEKITEQASAKIPFEKVLTVKLNQCALRYDDTDESTSRGSTHNGAQKIESSNGTKDDGNNANLNLDVDKLANIKKGVKSTKATKSSKSPKMSKNTVVKPKPAGRKKKKVECPNYKIIEGTMLAVDAFRYGDIDGVKNYFLSHFHADHYIGLKKSFNHKLYVSKITGRLVVECIKVDEKYIQWLDINTPIIVDEVEVTALDANHCPGAVMFLFKLKTGKCILHTGDFRASPDMEEYPEFWNNNIDVIYLDTTYLSSKYEFSTQSDSVALIIQYCREFIKSSTSSSGKHLIICGAYKIGKEKVWLRIAQEFNYKVWINSERQKVMQCIQNDEINGILTTHAKDASIHVLPLGSISYPFIVEYVNQFGEAFCKVLAIRPSGWEKQRAKPNFANRITILGVQYSEHSSYNELERFVRFLRPKKVISTVPFTSQNLARTPTIPDSWLNPKLEPKSQSYQRNIKDYMVKAGLKSSNTESDAPKNPVKIEKSSEAQHILDSISISDENDDYLQ